MTIQIADIVFIENDKILLVQQRKPSAYGLWSYPGGRVEPGETVQQAIVREVKEEISIDVINPKFFKQYIIISDDGQLCINTFRGEFDGTIKIPEDELIDFGWFSLEEMESGKISLRVPVVLEQARDALKKSSL